MADCELCPRKCRADRAGGQKGYCKADGRILIARAAPHMWEEPCISGSKGSGAVFFSGCNLHCVYCQNKDISDGTKGIEVTVDRLSEIFLELQAKKVYNINLVTATHYSDSIAEAVAKARKNGLTIPVVYNCGGYESVDAVKMLYDTVDIWMPDMKYISSDTAQRYSSCPDYFEKASRALEEMVGQVRKKGGTCFKEECGEADTPAEKVKERIMTRGVIVRHLLLPGHIAESKRILRYLHQNYGNDIYISIMSQYTPMPHIMSDDRFPELKNKVLGEEYDRLVDFALKLGIENAFVQEGETALESFIPEFDGEGVF